MMSFCPHCGGQLATEKPVEAETKKLIIPPVPVSEKSVTLESLKKKIHDMAPRFESMNDEEYNEWLDALPQDEFLAYIALDGEGIANEIRIGQGESTRK